MIGPKTLLFISGIVVLFLLYLYFATTPTELENQVIYEPQLQIESPTQVLTQSPTNLPTQPPTQLPTSSPTQQLQQGIKITELQICENNCYDHGRCFFNRCFCSPGWGKDFNCSEAWKEIPECFRNEDIQGFEPPGIYADLCFEHPDYGIAIVSMERWTLAQEKESALWSNTGATHDRADQHARSFGYYQALPDNLGKVLEVGCGPYTQLKWILESINRNFQTTSITLQDPGIPNYLKLKTCSYADGKLSGRPVQMITGGTEDLDQLQEEFDTLVIINVIEHVWNTFEVLEKVHQALKVGGIMVFNTRVLYPPDRRWEYEAYHPIRLKPLFWDFFYSQYEILWRKDEGIESYAILKKIK